MSALVAGAIAGGALLGGYFNYKQQERANELNEALTRESWARDDTAVQRRVKDLIAAGLSPTLAAGSAASTTAPIRINPAQFDSNSVLQSLTLAGELEQQQKNIVHTQADTERVLAEKANAESQKAVNEATKLKVEADTANANLQREIAEQTKADVIKQAGEQTKASVLGNASKELDNTLKAHDVGVYTSQPYASGDKDQLTTAARSVGSAFNQASKAVGGAVKQGVSTLGSGVKSAYKWIKGKYDSLPKVKDNSFMQKKWSSYKK